MSQLLNVYPPLVCAVKVTLVVASYHHPLVGPAVPAGFLVGWEPSPVGSVVTVKRYWVFQFHVMLEGRFIVNVVVIPVPEAGTLPDAVQPVQTYCVPVGPGEGEVTDALIDVPESNHPLVGLGESQAEETVR